MTRTAYKASLKLWTKRHGDYQDELDAAHKRNDKAGIEHWHAQLAHAGKMIRRRRAQLAPVLPLRERAYKVAESLVGVMEQGGNNAGPMVSRIIRENGGSGPEAWCGDFQAYCYRHGGSHAVSRPWASVRLVGQLLGIRRVTTPQRGDLVRFTFDHIGMYVDWCDAHGHPVSRAVATHLRTIEGNTGASGAVSDSSTGGDGVYEKVRAKSLVHDYLRVTR